MSHPKPPPITNNKAFDEKLLSILQAEARKSGVPLETLLNTAQQAGLAVKTETDKILDSLITQDADLKRLKNKVKLLATKNIPVLILGETGTGKELIARALHGARKGPFVPVNCSCISETLMESEFFGVKKGSFTDAKDDRQGLFEYAKDGTLFLDEIGDMPFYMQTKLLRALESKRIRRVGETHEREINCRIIAATNVLELEGSSLTGGKGFRQDLYYRLAVSVVKTKPLRERREDIKLIVEYYDKQLKINPVLIEGWINNEDLFPFKGNVRQLKNMIEEHIELDGLEGF